MSASSFAITFDSVEDELAHLKVVLAEKEEVIEQLRNHWNKSLEEMDEMQVQLNRFMGLEPENKRLTEENTALRRQIDNENGIDTSELITKYEDLQKLNERLRYSVNQLSFNQVGTINGKFGCWSKNQKSREHFKAWIDLCDSKGLLDPPIMPGSPYSMRTVKLIFRYKKLFKKNMRTIYNVKVNQYNNHSEKSVRFC